VDVGNPQAYGFPLDFGGLTWLPEMYLSPRSTIWTPAITVENLLRPQPADDARSPRRIEKFTVNNEGFVWLSFRSLINVKCKMDFSDMPYDVQRCNLRMLSTEDVGRISLSPYAPPTPLYDPRTAADNFSNAPHRLADLSNVEWACERVETISPVGHASSYLDEGKPLFDLVLVLRRKHEWYEQHVIEPVIFLILVAWASFFISRSAAPARIAMTLICFLTLSNIESTIRIQLPRVGYENRLLRLVARSRIFVFSSIIEYAMANWLTRVEKRMEGRIAAARLAAAPASTSSTKAINDGTASQDVESEDVAVEVYEVGKSSGARRVETHGSNVTRTTAYRPSRCVSYVESLLVSPNGRLRVRGQQLDVAARYLYPVAFAAVLLSFYK